MTHHFFEPQAPRLEAIVYAEFDNKIGRVIKYQVPREVLDKQGFDAISSAIIPSEEMRGRMIKINMYDYKIMGHPVGIQDKKYERKVYIFNMCFIVSKNIESDSVYEPLVQKCAEYLIDLEKECEFLSTNDERRKAELPKLMSKIFNGLNDKGECIFTVTDQTTLYLKLCPSFHGREPPPVNPFMVPIFTRIPPPTSAEQLHKMDVLSQKICPHIDGVRCVKDIAQVVQIDADLVGRCIRNLYFFGCITLMPMFLYSNTYIATENIRHFHDSPKIIEDCLKFAARNPKEPLPTFADVFRLYLSLKRGMTLKDWCLRVQPKQYNVDERKLVQFGIYYGFVRKLLVYPISTNNDGFTKIASLCNGENSVEDLALHYNCSPADLYRQLVANGNFAFITR